MLLASHVIVIDAIIASDALDACRSSFAWINAGIGVIFQLVLIDIANGIISSYVESGLDV